MIDDINTALALSWDITGLAAATGFLQSPNYMDLVVVRDLGRTRGITCNVHVETTVVCGSGQMLVDFALVASDNPNMLSGGILAPDADIIGRSGFRATDPDGALSGSYFIEKLTAGLDFEIPIGVLADSLRGRRHVGFVAIGGAGSGPLTAGVITATLTTARQHRTTYPIGYTVT